MTGRHSETRTWPSFCLNPVILVDEEPKIKTGHDRKDVVKFLSSATPAGNGREASESSQQASVNRFVFPGVSGRQ